MKSVRGALILAGVISQCLSAAASADTAPTVGNNVLDEVVVTSQRREERLQDVPISISAYSQAAMDQQGIRSIDDISRLTPGITFSHGTNFNSESSNITIRGIESNAGAATTGVYVDDTPIQSRHLSFGTFNAYPVLFDIDRVEVLRGPQGTLFGAGSEGGTVRFITPEPSLKQTSAYARAEFGATAHGDPVYEVGVAGGGPITDDVLGFRASASYRDEGGYVDHVNWHTGTISQKASNSSKTMTARVALKFAIGDSVTVTPSLYYQKRDVNDTAAWWSPVPGTEDPTNGQFSTPFRNGNAIANPSTDKFFLPALKVTVDLGAIRLVSNTSFFKRDESAVTDYTSFDRSIFFFNPYPTAGVAAPTAWADNQENWTQEFRLESTDNAARVTWTAGLFYQHAKENTIENVYDPAVLTAIEAPVGDGYIYKQDPYSSLDRQLAIFGQADAKLTDKLKLTVGLRYAKADFEGHAHYTGFVVGPPVTSSGTLNENPVTPKIGLNYQVDADNLLYATAAKGYRIGGTNAAVGVGCYGPGSALEAIGLTSVPSQYNSDNVWSYEVGSKNSFADHRVLFNASAYMIKWKDIQQNVQLSSCGFQFTGNLGEATSQGFDLQTQIKVNDALNVGGTFAYNDAHYTQTVRLLATALSIVQDNDHLSASPWTLSLFSQVNFPAFGRDGYARADYQYSAKQTDATPNQNPLNGGYSLWYNGVPAQSYTSLRAGVKWNRLDVSLYAQNLFDTHPKLTGNQDIGTPTGGTPLFYYITWRPRTVGITATYRY